MSGVEITSAQARIDGKVVARIDLVPTGGGTVSKGRLDNGEEVFETHETGEVFHVRFMSPDPTIPDQLLEVASYADATKAVDAWVKKYESHSAAIAEIAADLKA